MKFYKIIILIAVLIATSHAQFTDVMINIDYSNINEQEMFVFENFEEELRAYFLNHYFFDEPDELELMLDIHMVIENVNNKGGEKIVSALIVFSNQKDQHHISKSFDFAYNRGEALYKTEIFHSLTSLLNCYAYLQIAYELDTYQYLGGNKYFLKAQNIATDGKNSMYSRNWQSRLKKIRKESENYIYRDVRYNFWSSVDALEIEPPNYELANNAYAKFYESILTYEEYYGYSKPLSHFLNAYNVEIVQLAKKLHEMEWPSAPLINYLSRYDESNKHIYQKYYED